MIAAAGDSDRVRAGESTKIREINDDELFGVELRGGQRNGTDKSRLMQTMRRDEGDAAGLRHGGDEGLRVFCIVHEHVPPTAMGRAGIVVDRVGVRDFARGRFDASHHAGGAANAHGRDRRADLHVAGIGDLAGDEAERAFDQREQRLVRRRFRVDNHIR